MNLSHCSYWYHRSSSRGPCWWTQRAKSTTRAGSCSSSIHTEPERCRRPRGSSSWRSTPYSFIRNSETAANFKYLWVWTNPYDQARTVTSSSKVKDIFSACEKQDVSNTEHLKWLLLFPALTDGHSPDTRQDLTGLFTEKPQSGEVTVGQGDDWKW